jgi:DNA-binding transcriptional ArsR family regulator
MLAFEQVQFLRSIRKASVVLMALLWLGRPARPSQLAEMLELSDNTARRYLRTLLHAGLVCAAPRQEGEAGSFVASERAARLFFCAPERKFCAPIVIVDSDSEIKDSSTTTTQETGPLKNCARTAFQARRTDEPLDDFAGLFWPAGEIPPDALPPQADDPPEAEPVRAAGETPAASPSRRSPAASTSRLDPELRRAYAEAGLLLTPRTRQLATLPHVTPEYVRLHKRALAERGEAHKTGLLVRILEDGLPVPQVQQGGHLSGCTCPDCSRRAYADWESG